MGSFSMLKTGVCLCYQEDAEASSKAHETIPEAIAAWRSRKTAEHRKKGGAADRQKLLNTWENPYKGITITLAQRCSGRSDSVQNTPSAAKLQTRTGDFRWGQQLWPTELGGPN